MLDIESCSTRSKEIPDIVMQHLADITFGADLDYIRESSDKSISIKEKEYFENLKLISKNNGELIKELAETANGASSFGEDYIGGTFKDASSWFLYRQFIKYIKPNSLDDNLFGVNIHNLDYYGNKTKTEKERRTLPAAILGQYPFTNKDGEIEYLTIGLADSYSLINQYGTNGKQYLSSRAYYKRPGIDKKLYRIDDWKTDSVLIKFETSERIERNYNNIPEPQEIRESYFPEKQIFIYNTDISKKYSPILQARNIVSLENTGIDDSTMKEMNLLENTLNFAFFGPEDNEQLINTIIERYSRQRKFLLNSLSD